MDASATQAIVLMIGDRYYYPTDNGRIQTAWSLSGAKLFKYNNPTEIELAESFIRSKGKKCHREIVSLDIITDRIGLVDVIVPDVDLDLPY